MTIIWNKVTKFSQAVAIVLFVIVFFVGFTIGKEYGKSLISGTPGISENSFVGCYVAHLANDVYSLKVTRSQNGIIEGTLDINNAEKDSSTGTLKGTYKDGILLADYTFQSEGTTSLMQVIFKKVGNDFVRGYGKPDDATGTRFVDLSKINYDTSTVYKVSTDGCKTVSQ